MLAPEKAELRSTYREVPIAMEQIDPVMRTVIQAWNRLSFTRTLFCCSGHPADEVEVGRVALPYILFAIQRTSRFTPDFLDRLSEFCGFCLDGHQVQFDLVYYKRQNWPGFLPSSDLAFRFGYAKWTSGSASCLPREELRVYERKLWPRVVVMLSRFESPLLGTDVFNPQRMATSL